MATGYNGASGGEEESWDDSDPGKVIPASFDMDDKSISYDKEATNVWKVPKPKFTKRMITYHGADVATIKAEKDPKTLQNFILDHLEIIKSARKVQNAIQRLVDTYAPSEMQVVPDMDPVILVKNLEDILEIQRKKLALLDISLEGSQLLEGTVLQIKLDESRKKISEILESYRRRLNDAEDNVWNLQEIIQEHVVREKEYEARIGDLYNYIINLKQAEGRTVAEPSQDEASFVSELRKHLEDEAHLHSSFKDELALEKKTKHSLFQEICRLKEQRILDEQKKERQMAEMAKDLELEEGIRKGITEKIKTLTPNSDEIHSAVNDWMNEIDSCISQREEEIRMKKENIKILEDQIAEMTRDYNEFSEKGQELNIAERRFEQ